MNAPNESPNPRNQNNRRQPLSQTCCQDRSKDKAIRSENSYLPVGDYLSPKRSQCFKALKPSNSENKHKPTESKSRKAFLPFKAREISEKSAFCFDGLRRPKGARFRCDVVWRRIGWVGVWLGVLGWLLGPFSTATTQFLDVKLSVGSRKGQNWFFRRSMMIWRRRWCVWSHGVFGLKVVGLRLSLWRWLWSDWLSGFHSLAALSQSRLRSRSNAPQPSLFLCSRWPLTFLYTIEIIYFPPTFLFISLARNLIRDISRVKDDLGMIEKSNAKLNQMATKDMNLLIYEHLFFDILFCTCVIFLSSSDSSCDLRYVKLESDTLIEKLKAGLSCTSSKTLLSCQNEPVFQVPTHERCGSQLFFEISNCLECLEALGVSFVWFQFCFWWNVQVCWVIRRFSANKAFELGRMCLTKVTSVLETMMIDIRTRNRWKQDISIGKGVQGRGCFEKSEDLMDVYHKESLCLTNHQEPE